MSTDPQKTIQEIIDLYLGEEHPDEHTQEQFRAWLAGDGHRKEKYEALEKAFEREVRFDPADGIRAGHCIYNAASWLH